MGHKTKPEVMILGEKMGMVEKWGSGLTGIKGRKRPVDSCAEQDSGVVGQCDRADSCAGQWGGGSFSSVTFFKDDFV